MNARETIETVLRNRGEPSPWTAANDILAALKEAGYAVVDVEPAREQVWLQNLCGFIDGKFIPVDDRWQEIWKQRVRALAAAQEQEEG